MTKRIAIIQGHPDPCGNHFAHALAQAYVNGAKEGANAASTLLELARVNHVDLIVLGAPGASERALAWWRSGASSVTANAHCSVHVVRTPEPRLEIASDSA